MVEYLIDHGANLAQQDQRGLTPANQARRFNKPSILDLLLRRGAAPLNIKKKEKEVKPKVVEAPK